ncbi:MAG: CDP-alcohol phosphatidyltransferase family protein [Rhodospirillales bacterium]
MNAGYPFKRPRTLFPLIRQVSARTSPYLARLPLSANHVTAISLITVIAACWCLAQGGYGWTMAGAALFTLFYVLDNCDGEIARYKDQSSEFGYKFDTFVDWVGHALFFSALGLGVARETGNDIWLWLGLLGGAGATINYFVAIWLDARLAARPGGGFDSTGRGKIEDPDIPDNWKQWLIFAFRELTRADFCFIVLVLAIWGWAWVLLPTAAVGAHAYWITQFASGARDYQA